MSALGVTLPQFGSDAPRVMAAARRAEALGLDSVWLFDHMWPLSGGRLRPILEAWTTLAGVAAATSAVTVGTLVTRATVRNPAVLGRMAATVSAIAPGRLVVGIGTGDELSRAENEAFGLPYAAGRDRISHLEAAVAALGSAAPEVPVWVGGRSERVVRVAARIADGYNAWGVDAPGLARRVELLRSAGRGVVATWGGRAVLAATDAEAAARARGGEDVVGAPAAVAAHLADIAAAGASHLVVAFAGADAAAGFELLAAEVRPRLGAASDTPRG